MVLTFSDGSGVVDCGSNGCCLLISFWLCAASHLTDVTDALWKSANTPRRCLELGKGNKSSEVHLGHQAVSVLFVSRKDMNPLMSHKLIFFILCK